MKNGLQEVYGSIVDYHNSLVNMRFTVAGLYLTGSAFLVTALFSKHQWCYTKITVCLLGLALTLIVFILEIRTKQLLENLGELGGWIEEIDYGFFELMKKQPIPPKIPFSDRTMPFAKYVTHTNGLYCLYIF